MRTLSNMTMLLVLGVVSMTCKAEAPMAPVIERGACPFECCTYGDWGVSQDTTLRVAPSAAAAVVTLARAGSKVKALTGEVHVTPTKLVVTRPRDAYKKGDVIWVLNYLGEGLFKVSFNGKTREESLGISPYGGTAVDDCKQSPDCPGELQGELNSTWWVQIKTRDGKTGWTDEAENFSGRDNCGR